MLELTLDQAERELIAWTAANACRDDVIRAAHHAGVSKARIYAITGIARTTIDRILEERTVRRGFMQMATREDIAHFLEPTIQNWPRDPNWQSPFAYRLPQQAVADQLSAEQLAGQLLEMAGFRALRLGTWLNTPDGELIAAAVESLTPPPYKVDAQLLIEALKLAATKQRSAELEKVVGVGVVASIGAVLLSASRG